MSYLKAAAFKSLDKLSFDDTGKTSEFTVVTEYHT